MCNKYNTIEYENLYENVSKMQLNLQTFLCLKSIKIIPWNID